MRKLELSQQKVMDLMSQSENFNEILQPTGVEKGYAYLNLGFVTFLVFRRLDDMFQVYLPSSSLNEDNDGRYKISRYAKMVEDACNSILRENKEKMK